MPAAHFHEWAVGATLAHLRREIMKSFTSFLLALFTITISYWAYVLCLTVNDEMFGGYLPFLVFSLSPIYWYYFGRFVQSAS